MLLAFNTPVRKGIERMGLAVGLLSLPPFLGRVGPCHYRPITIRITIQVNTSSNGDCKNHLAKVL